MDLLDEVSKEDVDFALARAKTYLNKEFPFYGSILMSVKVTEDNERVSTMATDGTSIIWNREFVQKINAQELAGVFVHEVLHILFKHPLRMKNRDHKRWNYACDYVINPIVLDAVGINGGKLALPKDCLFEDKYKTLRAETCYSRIQDEEEKEGGNGGSGSGDMPEWGAVIEPTKSDGTSLSESDIKRQERAIDDILVTASQYRGRGTIPAELQGIIDKLLEPQVLWEEELEKFVGGEQPEDYSYKRIHKVALEVLDVLNPTSDRFGSGHLVVGQDQSASVSDKELQKGFSELNYISEKFSPEQVTVIPFDGNVKEDKVQVFDKGEIIEKLDIKGRGGTNVAPLFDYIEKEQMEIDKLIIFSDMEIWDYPKEPPAFPVLWVSVNENGLPAPFGQTIHIK